MGLIGYWKFDEGTGTTVADSSNSGHRGIFSGASWQIGRDGTSGVGFRGNNTTDKVEISGSSGINRSGFSVCAWVRGPAGGQVSSGATEYGVIASKITVDGWNNGQGWILGQMSSGASFANTYFMALEMNGGDSWYTSHSQAYADDTGWHHVVATISSGVTGKIYVDGDDDLYANQIRAPWANYAAPTSNIRIGNNYDNESWSGVIDDVRIYDTVLTSGEVWSLYSTYLGKTSKYGLPAQDITTGLWTQAPFWSKINTDNGDADWISSGPNPTDDVCEVLLTGCIDPNTYSGLSVNYRYREDNSSSFIVGLTVGLYQNTTLIAEKTHTGIPLGWVTTGFSLTTGEAASITDYSDLRLRFTANSG